MATAQAIIGYVIPITLVVQYGKNHDWKSVEPVQKILNKTTLAEGDVKAFEGLMQDVQKLIEDKNQKKHETLNLKLMVNNSKLDSTVIIFYDTNNRLTQVWIPTLSYQYVKINTKMDDFFKDLIYELCLKNGQLFVEYSTKHVFLSNINSVDPQQLM
jgi:hypothetical protein